jgi:hypothetical protein
LVESTVCFEEKCYEERVREPNLVVHELSVDLSGIGKVVNKRKTRFFTKLGFLKPKREDIDCESISLYYEPFHIVNARYRVDYYRRNIYPVRVDDNVREVIIFDRKLDPENPKRVKHLLKRSHREIKLPAEDRIIHEAAAHVAQDRTGREIDPSKLPYAPALKEPEKALEEYGEKVRKFMVSPDRLIDIIRERIVRKPSETERIVEEVFEVSENTVTYTPVYEARCRYLKTGEIKIIPISGVTRKPFFP